MPAAAFLRALPNLGAEPFGPPPGFPVLPPLLPVFIRFALKPLRSPELMASPDFMCLFLPPWPYLESFFCRLAFLPPDSPPNERFLPADLLPSSLSTATSKRSSASVAPRAPEEPSARSVFGEFS